MKPAHVLRRAIGYLERHHVQSPRATAELLLAGVLDTDRSGLYTSAADLSPQEAQRFGRALCLRCAGTPTQHIMGVQGFCGLTLRVRPGVFIPRPETEGLVQLVLAELPATPSPVLADVGTGTGAIALAIAHERPDAQVLALDISPEAVELARENATHLDLPVEVLSSDLLDRLPPDLLGGLDAVVSNPPYIALDELPDLPPEVRADPATALVGGIDGYATLAEQAARWLRSSGLLAVEIGQTQASEVADAFADAGFDDPNVAADLAGRDRFVLARRA